MTIKSDGNVGIGTADPDGTLHVHTATAGSVTAHTNYDDLIVEGSGATGIQVLAPDASAAGIAFGSPTDNAGAAVIWVHNNDLLTIGTWNAGADISIVAGDGDEAVRILDDGKVGIGTSSPDSLLDLSSSSHTEMHIQSTGTGVNTVTFASTPTATDQRIMRLDSQWGSNIVARIHGNTGDDTTNKDDGYLTFYTAAGGSLAERMRIEQDGRVGIGTASPDSLLDVDAGGSALVVTFQGSNAGLNLTNQTRNWLIFSDDSPDQLRFRDTTAGLDRIVIDSAGKVGINETDPDQLLHVKYGTGNNHILKIEHTHATTPYGMEVTFTGGAPDDNTRWFGRFQDTGAVRAYLYSDGDWQNHDNAYGAISDARLKSNIEYQTPAVRSYWEDWKAIKFAKFELNDDIAQYGPGVKGTRFGVIAQDMQADWGGLVKSHFDEKAGEERFGFNYSTFNTIGSYVLQEALEEIDLLKANLAEARKEIKQLAA